MSSLRKKVLDTLLEDIQVAKSMYDSKDAVIQDIEFDGDSSVEFKMVLPDLSTVNLSLCIPDNYPKEDLTLLTPGAGLTFSNDIKIFAAANLPDVFGKIVESYWKDKKPAGGASKGKDKEAGGDNDKTTKESDGKGKEKGKGKGKGKGKEKESEGGSGEKKRKKLKDSNYFDDDSYGDIDDDDGFVDDPDAVIGSEWESGGDPFLQIDEKEAEIVRKKLMQDVEGVRKRYGKCGLYHDDVTHEYIVRMSLDTSSLDKWTAAAWGVNNTMPIIVEVQFTWQYLNDRRMPPKVLSVTQAPAQDLNAKVLNNTRDFGLRWYLNNRLADTFRRNWVKYYRNQEDDNIRMISLSKSGDDKKKKKAEAKKSEEKKPEGSPKTKKSDKKDKKSKKGKTVTPKSKKKKDKGKDKAPSSPASSSSASSSSSSSSSKSSKVDEASPYPKQVSKLCEMGFGRRLAILALAETDGEVDAAAAMLTDKDAARALEHAAEAQAQHLDLIKEATNRGFAGISPAQVEKLENFFDGPNFLLQVHDYLVLRMKTCSTSCVICDAPLGYAGVKPTVCTKPLCTHSFDSYGLGFSLTSELRHNPEVVDLLVTITVGAAKNRRTNGADVFEPYPDAVQVVVKDKFGNEVSTRSFRTGATKDYDLVAAVCDKLPSINEMKPFTDEMQLKAFLDNCDTLCYPLLRWILMTNRAHLSLLPPEKQVKEMQTPHQYVLVSDNPQKELLFRQKRAANAKARGGRGSFYAFHGSAIGNWHSIFRNGLKNFSNTDKMSAGAAYGPGIYMAADASTSFGYMAAGQGWSKSSLNAGSVACIALGEVVDYRNQSTGLWGSGPNPVNVHGGIYVITDETIVVTRYFFIYATTSYYSHSAPADGLKLPEDIYSDK